MPWRGAIRTSDRMAIQPTPAPHVKPPVTALAVLLAGSPLMAMMFAALGPTLPLLAKHFGGPFAAQMIMTVPAIGVVIGGLVAGVMVDRFGPRPILLAGLAAYGLAGSSGLYVDNLTILLAARLILGLAVAHVSTAIGVIVGAWFTGLSRARFLGFQAGTAGVCALIFLVLSGVLAERIGWRAPFGIYLLAFPVLLTAALGLRSAPLPKRRIEAAGSVGDLLGLWRIYLLAMCLFAGYFMTSIQLSFLLAEDHVDSPIQRALVIAGGVLAGGLMGAAYGPLLARLGARVMPCLVIGLLGTGLFIIGISSTVPLIAVGAAISGGAGGMIAPHIETLILGRAPVEIRARAISFMFTVLYVADFLNPLIVTPLRAVTGIHGAFIVIGGVLLASALAVLLMPRSKSVVGLDAHKHLT